jgi:hypothetical protein
MEHCLDDFTTLKSLIEVEQGVDVTIKSSTHISSNISIQPVKDIKIDGRSLVVVFRIEESNLVLSWLYLLHLRQGTGMKIICWFINYCKYSEISKMRIAAVKDDKLGMRRLCEKLGFTRCNENQGFSDYYLEIK